MLSHLGLPACFLVVLSVGALPSLEAQTSFVRGDFNDDSVLGIADPLAILFRLFGGGAAKACLDSADANDDGLLDTSDAVFLLEWMYLGGNPPPDPSFECGVDPTEDGIDCECSRCQDPATSVVRGPYLQTGTSTSVIVKWRTASAVHGEVRYGPAPGELTVTKRNPGVTTEHEVLLSGLSPDTLYYYSIGSSSALLAGDDLDHFFLTAPIPGTVKPTRVWVLGDPGAANTRARDVREAYFGFTGETHTDLWLMLGDNAYDDGLDDEYQDAVFEMYPSMLRKSVLWSTLGNHDNFDSVNQVWPYFEVLTFPTNGEAGGVPSGTESYFSFDYANIHFVSVDSEETDRSIDAPMLTWLAEDLAATTQRWTVAFFHNPPYSKGNHDSDTMIDLTEMRENAIPILEGGGVDLVLCGHSHNYERSYLLDGHYDVSDTLEESMFKSRGDGRIDGDGAYVKSPGPHQGTVYVVCGSSSRVTVNGTLDHPVMFLSMRTVGSLVLDVDGDQLALTFVDRDGTTHDTFAIIKQ